MSLLERGLFPSLWRQGAELASTCWTPLQKKSFETFGSLNTGSLLSCVDATSCEKTVFLGQSVAIIAFAVSNDGESDVTATVNFEAYDEIETLDQSFTETIFQQPGAFESTPFTTAAPWTTPSRRWTGAQQLRWLSMLMGTWIGSLAAASAFRLAMRQIAAPRPAPARSSSTDNQQQPIVVYIFGGQRKSDEPATSRLT
eukprot:TRINITY_DN15616_c0_g1_i1.p1 TRINITY_DN15616_c0_g1~~TRINITY_DN15616_c0_g1_i1.p1  ORF type:complete len:199 (-),score=16.01 TRINITY_DN15616_c0_g1_i1:467-1063(-)